MWCKFFNRIYKLTMHANLDIYIYIYVEEYKSYISLVKLVHNTTEIITIRYIDCSCNTTGKVNLKTFGTKKNHLFLIFTCETD